jgi:hypothetical protein
MGKFFLDGETFRVKFVDGEWVDIKEEFAQADLDYITTQMMKTSVNTRNGKNPEADVSFAFGKVASLTRAIVAWSFAEDGKPVPVTAENISNLRNRYRTVLLTEIDRLNAEAGAFAKN